MNKSREKGFGASNVSKRQASKLEKTNESTTDSLKQQQAETLISLGKLQEAEAIYKNLVSQGSSSHIVYGNLGALLKLKGDSQSAIKHLKKAIQLNSDYPEAYYNLGIISKEQGNLSAAIASYKKAIQYKYNYPKAHNNLGIALREQDDLPAAIASFKSALTLNPNYSAAYYNLGNALQDMGDLDAALLNHKKALKLDTNHADAFYGIGRIQAVQGSLRESRISFKKAIELNPNHTATFFELSKHIHSFKDSAELLKQINKVGRAGLKKREVALLDFAFANCYHKSKDFTKATQHLALANKQKLQYLPSDLSEHLYRTKQICEQSLKIDQGNMKDGLGRIFIIGAPRCGSTLLESVLSTNPLIRDLGESKAMSKAFIRVNEGLRNRDGFLSVSETYAEETKEKLREYTHSVDKNLYNFRFTQAIINAMPAAKIIYCCRHPLDNILSMLRSNLKVGNNYTADPLDAAKFLIHQEQIMKIYRYKYEDRIYTFDYDIFTTFPNKVLHSLIDWLELEWNESYLHPEISHRLVHTASVFQARQPINNKSVGGWKNYRDLLKPAEDALLKSGIFDL